MKIDVNSSPTPALLEKLHVATWPIWTKEVSRFPYTYDEVERCLFLEGDVTVTPEGGTGVHIKKGDFVTFPAGMNCTWNIISPVKKHYKFG